MTTTSDLPTTKLEAWRYVDCTALDFSPTGGSSDLSLPDFLSSEAQLSCTPAGAIWSGDTPGWRRGTPPTASIIAADAAADDHLAVHLIDVPPTAMEALAAPTPLLIVLGGGRHRLHLSIPAGTQAEVLLVHRLPAATRAQLGIELNLGQDALVHIDEIDYHSTDAQLLSSRRAQLAQGAQLSWGAASCGGPLHRHDWRVDLAGPGAEVVLAGATLLHDARQAHHYVRVNHRAPHTRSEQLFRCVAHDRGRHSFDGLITIDPGCDGSAAEQSAHMLQLSPQARLFARPQLDIHTDEVTATHGATIGQPDGDEQVYLRSRGLPKQLADQLVIRGFLDEVIHRFHSVALKQHAAGHPSLRDWLME